MRITSYGNASVKIEAGDETLFFDPYLKDSVKIDEPEWKKVKRKEELSKAINVLITHGHFDHLGSIHTLYHSGNAKIYCTKTPTRTLKKRGLSDDKIHLISPGDSIKFGNVTVCAYHTAHCRFNVGEIRDVFLRHGAFCHLGKLLRLLYLDKTYPSGNECLFYEILSEGMRIQLLGSAGLDKNTDYPKNADILILPYQGRSDMADYCMKIVKRLEPKRVLLDHYDDSFPPMTTLEDTEEFIKAMAKNCPEIPCGTLEEFKTIEI